MRFARMGLRIQTNVASVLASGPFRTFPRFGQGGTADQWLHPSAD